jgi:hypothetical protein
LRLLAETVPRLQKDAISGALAPLAREVAEEFADRLSPEERELLRALPGIRNKLLHVELSRAAGRVKNFAQELHDAEVIKIDLTTGDVARVRSTSTQEGGISGWLLESASSGSFAAGVRLFAHGIYILERLLGVWEEQGVAASAEQQDSGSDGESDSESRRAWSARTIALPDGLSELPWGPIAEMNAGERFASFVEELAREEQPTVAALGKRAAFALGEALELAPAAALYAIETVCARLCCMPASDAAQNAANDMISAGFYSLCGDAEAADLAKLFGAVAEGSTNPDSNAVKIRALYRVVRMCIACSGVEKLAPQVPTFLLSSLATLDQSVRERVTEADLAELLVQYGPRRAPGQRTAEGVVAQIMLRGRLLGVGPNHTEHHVLQRVRNALKAGA